MLLEKCQNYDTKPSVSCGLNDFLLWREKNPHDFLSEGCLSQKDENATRNIDTLISLGLCYLLPLLICISSSIILNDAWLQLTAKE